MILVQSLQIQQVLGPAARALRFPKGLEAEDMDGDAVIRSGDALCPCRRKIQTGDSHEDINAIGRHADLINQFRVLEVRGNNVRERRAKPAQGKHGSFCVVRRRVDPQVQVLGVPRLGIMDHRMRADHQILNALSVQYAEQIFEVWIRWHDGS